MKYHYDHPEITVPVYGEYIDLLYHPIYQSGTLFRENSKGLIVVQQHFSRNVEALNSKFCYWGPVDPAVANDIYLSPNFHEFFLAEAKDKSEYPIFQLRKIMWALRMKPLKHEPWEDFFGTT